MLRKQAIIVGKYYVNNSRKVAREVLGADDKTVRFITHHLDTGNSCGSASECTRQDFIHWANREATSAEIASVQAQEMEAHFRAPQVPDRDALEAEASSLEKSSIMS
jgi:hypothetical protein